MPKRKTQDERLKEIADRFKADMKKLGLGVSISAAGPTRRRSHDCRVCAGEGERRMSGPSRSAALTTAKPTPPKKYRVWVDLIDGTTIQYDAQSPPPVFAGMALNLVIDGKNVLLPYHSLLKVTYRTVEPAGENNQ